MVVWVSGLWCPGAYRMDGISELITGPYITLRRPGWLTVNVLLDQCF
jgi:hypothetical protein